MSSVVVGGMWGTSNLSLFLIDVSSGRAIDQKRGPGVSRVSGGEFEQVLFACISHWCEEHPHVPIVLSGMVGSTIGWVEAEYLRCPADTGSLAGRCVEFVVRGHPVRIIPGLSCINVLGESDLMRGEETEVLAWVCGSGERAGYDGLVCLPGTHSKWVRLCGGRIENFLTCVTGEVYDVLGVNGVLTGGQSSGSGGLEGAFRSGVCLIADCPERLLSCLFSVRARVVSGIMEPSEASDFMSGILIGADIGLCRQAMEFPGLSVPVIGSSDLVERYVYAGSCMGVDMEPLWSRDLMVRGLYLVWRQLSGGEV